MFINPWKVRAAFLIPNRMTMQLYNPSGVILKAVKTFH